MYPGIESHLRVAGWPVTAAEREKVTGYITKFATPILRFQYWE